MSCVTPARTVAFQVLAAVREDDAYANLLLPTRIARAGLNTADAALATELCYGTLRLRGFYDRVIAIAARRTTEAIDAPILDVLRLGAHQLLGMRVPAHAAVNESVELARTVGSRSATGFANGVLREIGRHDQETWMRRVLAAAHDADDRLSARYSHPTWVVRALRRALVAEGRGDELPALLAADNEAPRVNMAALPGLAEPDPDAVADSYSPIGFRLASGDPHRLVEAAAGRIRVQDEGSQLVALTLSRARPVSAGERWLDLCAGPGGKAALLAADAAASGAGLTANELVPARSELVRRALAPVPGEVELWQRDGSTIGRTHPAGFDRILVDAPCTGLGALRRRPEARWRKQPADIPALAEIQAALLDSALAAVKPGGIVAYATCSPHPAETRAIVDHAVAATHGRVRTLPTARILGSVCRTPPELAGREDAVQLWPHRHGTDAMFLTLLTVDP